LDRTITLLRLCGVHVMSCSVMYVGWFDDYVYFKWSLCLHKV